MIPAVRFQKITIGMLTPPIFLKKIFYLGGGFTIRQPTLGWFLSGTKSNQRRYAAAKLISKLTGPARLLSMSWHRSDFDGEEGVTVMLQRLAASPLVRHSLPNAAAIMNEYFNFRRKLGESISQFLVRETLSFEEFQEALLELKDDRDGISPSQRAFDLPDVAFSAASDRGTLKI